MTDTRPCTCAPDERPYPCQHQYALGLCRKAEIRSLRIELDRCIAQIGDLTKIRLEDELVHGNVMGRIAIALFGEQNNRGDEDCVAQAIEVVRERNRLRQHLHDEHQRHVGTMNERDAALADLAAARAEVERLRAGGCARDQRTTQWCAEAEALRQDLAAARAESAKMRRWLDDAELAERREQCRAERAEADLAAARALLREARNYVADYVTSLDQEALADRIDAALSGERK